MATTHRSRCLIRALLCGAAILLSLPALAAGPRADDAARRLSWALSPYRHFGPAQALVPGGAALLDEAEDPELRSALATELRRLFEDLYGRQGWRVPFGGDEPLRIYVARREAGGVRDVAARSVEKGRLVAAAVLLDGTGLSTSQIVREVCRQVALATLRGYGAAEDEFLTSAAAEALSGAPQSDAKDEETWMRAAAPLVDFRARPATLGRLWVDELVRAAGGTGLLREAWERAGETGEGLQEVLSRSLLEAAGVSEETLLVRCAARLFASLEPEASPSRLRLLDLESGALDAAAPAARSVRHRTFLPEGAEEALRVQWPEDGGQGAAVVRYRDAMLPADVVFFAAGQRRTIPLSGVVRIDWLVAGSAAGGGDLRAPAYCDLSSATPFRGLDAHASAGPEGPRLAWTTAGHDGMWGWAVFREELLSDGRIARTGPEIVPSSLRSEDSFRYLFLDSTAAPGTFYRYTVWAVTDEGLLARAFAVTLKTE